MNPSALSKRTTQRRSGLASARHIASVGCRFFLVVSVIILAGALDAAQGRAEPEDTQQVRTVTVTLGRATLQAVLADTEPLRVQGLLGWEKIGEDQGMLLAFDRQAQYAIHMQGMKFPIDALWIDANGVIVLIYRNIRPNAGHAFPSFFPSKYCLEIKAGLADKYGIKEGQTVRFGPPTSGAK